jgi:hypothetical protein
MQSLNNQTAEFLNAARLQGDTPVDDFIKSIFANPEEKVKLLNRLKELHFNSQLAAPPFEIPASSKQLPAWADQKLMKAGAEFFALHAASIMQLLGLLSLPYCYAAANGAMVLYLSERIKTDTAKRLTETATFVWEVMAPDAFTAEGKGFASIYKVRLMHAAARYYAIKSGKWDDAWGVPVNQEDMAGTNLSFSLIVVRGLRDMGFAVAYIHLWNVIGNLMGLEESLLPLNGKQALDLEHAIRERQFKPSTQGRELTASLTNYFKTINTGNDFTNAEIFGLMRYLLGGEVAGIIGIDAPELSRNKIRLLRLLNLINDLRPGLKPIKAYKKGYRKFNVQVSPTKLINVEIVR